MLSDLRLLLQLWRDRRNNPLLWYHRPTRRSVAGVVFRLGELFALLSVIFAGLYLALLSEWNQYGRSIESIFLGLGLLAFIFPILFLFVAPGPWPRDRSQEIVLTRLTPAEVAFGFLFWPLLFSVIVGIGCGALAGAISYKMGYYQVNSRDSGAFSYGVLAFLAPLVIATYTLDRWFTTTAWRWLALVLVPFKIVPAGFLLAVLMQVLQSEVHALAGWLAIGLAALWCVTRLRVALHGAGVRILDRAAPEELLRTVWRVREKAIGKLPGGGLRRRFGLIRPAAPSLLISFFVNLILIKGAGRLYLFLRPPEAYGSRDMDVFALELFVIPASIAVSAILAALPTRGRLPALSGGVLWTVIVHTLPPVLIAVVCLLIAHLPRFDASDRTDWILLVGGGAMLALVVGAMVTLVIPRRGRLWSSALLVGTTALLAVLSRIGTGRIALDDAAIACVIIVVAALLFSDWLFLRIHRSELLDVPLGRLNTDDNSGLPLAPESVLDDMRMGR